MFFLGQAIGYIWKRYPGDFEISTDGNHYSHELKYMDMGQWEWSKFEISPNRIFKLCMA